MGSTSASSPAGASRSSARAARGRPRSRTSSSGSSTRRRAGSRSTAATCATTARRTCARTFALAGQEAHVFDSTIRENLRLARPAASDAELEDVVRQAQLSEWVATLPDGLDTFVGEEGSRLSGGQRQRLVLARALLADAPVLVLDEPTAHLDPQTATSLMDDVLDAAGDRAVLLITHRAEGLDRMDDVVRLDAAR